jgi:hypothetical protein
MTRHTLEPTAQQIAGATSKPPSLYELGLGGARKVLDGIQAAPIAKPDVGETLAVEEAPVCAPHPKEPGANVTAPSPACRAAPGPSCPPLPLPRLW